MKRSNTKKDRKQIKDLKELKNIQKMKLGQLKEKIGAKAWYKVFKPIVF